MGLLGLIVAFLVIKIAKIIQSLQNHIPIASRNFKIKVFVWNGCICGDNQKFALHFSKTHRQKTI